MIVPLITAQQIRNRRATPEQQRQHSRTVAPDIARRAKDQRDVTPTSDGTMRQPAIGRPRCRSSCCSGPPQRKDRELTSTPGHRRCPFPPACGLPIQITARPSGPVTRTSGSPLSVSGAWPHIATSHDTSGAVTDCCDSGSVTWSAGSCVQVSVVIRARRCGFSPIVNGRCAQDDSATG
jgi:hypothetical protein